VRAISDVAFGVQPSAITTRSDREELEKTIGSALMRGDQTLFLDNVNAQDMRSRTLTSAITERPSEVRMLGVSKLMRLNTSTFVAVTGNGLAIVEDLVRRFVEVRFDAQMESPETRRFDNDLLAEAKRDREAILADVLTVWRWGRLAPDIAHGRPAGSFEQWARHVRDPLLALSCRDPVERMSEAKRRDPSRMRVGLLFETWFRLHGSAWLKASDLHPEVLKLIDAEDQSRQNIVTRLQRFVDTRVAGLVLRQKIAAGRWTPHQYAVFETAEHGDGDAEGGHSPPISPYDPYASKRFENGWQRRERVTLAEISLSDVACDKTHRGHRRHRGRRWMSRASTGADARPA
jgi:hypothetical protein